MGKIKLKILLVGLILGLLLTSCTRKNVNSKNNLTKIQYEVTQNNATEPAFNNKYWDNYEPGIYVDIISGEPLFASIHKFNSQTGWPSFYQVLEPENLIYKQDRKLFNTRTEVRSKKADSHLGHVFDDGPEPTGKRYCINSAALRFVSQTNLVQEGYAKYENLLNKNNHKITYFAGGCFWCIEADFEKIPGVISVQSGYMGGSEKNPTYEQVSQGKTSHVEAVKIIYDSQKINYEKLVKIFWLLIDPTTHNKQFCDEGAQYRAIVFFNNQEEQEIINKSLLWLKQKFSHIKPVTESKLAPEFYLAESYHQDYYKKNPIRYKFYRTSCGRDSKLKKLYGPDRKIIIQDILKN